MILEKTPYIDGTMLCIMCKYPKVLERMGITRMQQVWYEVWWKSREKQESKSGNYSWWFLCTIWINKQYIFDDILVIICWAGCDMWFWIKSSGLDLNRLTSNCGVNRGYHEIILSMYLHLPAILFNPGSSIMLIISRVSCKTISQAGVSKTKLSCWVVK